MLVGNIFKRFFPTDFLNLLSEGSFLERGYRFAESLSAPFGTSDHLKAADRETLEEETASLMRKRALMAAL